MENGYRSERISIRISKEERIFLEGLAENSNYKTLSEFLRNVIFSSALDLNKIENNMIRKTNERVARLTALTYEIAKKELGKDEVNKIVAKVNENLNK